MQWNSSVIVYAVKNEREGTDVCSINYGPVIEVFQMWTRVRQTSYMSYALEQLLNSQSHGLFNHTGTNNSSRTSCKQYLKTRLTLPGGPIKTKRQESLVMDHTWQVLPVWGKEMSNTKPGHDTGTQPEASDKDGRNTSVTNRAGQATPRCQTATSIRQESGSDHVRLSCKPERMAYTWERNEIIHSSIQ